MRAPVSAPSHDGGLDKEAELSAIKAKMGALELAETRRQVEFEAMQADNKRLMGEVRNFLLSRRVAVCARKLNYVGYDLRDAWHKRL